MIHISVVIPSYNSQDNLRNTLDGIAGQIFSGEFEVVLVDCSETDEVQKVCESFNFVRCERVDERFNPGVGRNLGAKIARGTLLAFVDSDVVMSPESLENAWRYYSKGNRIFGGALELNESVETTAASYLEHYYFNHECQMGRPICTRSNLSSALMFVEKGIFIEQNGFKDIPRAQDTEFTERLASSGYQLTFNPTVIGLQIQDRPMNKVFSKIYISGRNLYFIRYMNLKWIKKTALFLLLPLLTMLKASRIIIRHMAYQSPRNRLITILLSPLFVLASICWMSGLYRSMIFGGGISSKRE